MEELKFLVYKHTNKTNGKTYIGITSQSPERRWNKGHGYINCTGFYRAIQKYGWNGFTHEILYQGLSNKEALDIETALIKEYKDLGLSYNIKDSNEWIGEKRKHSINVYEKNGTFIKHCASIHEASIEFNCSESGIYYCATAYRNTKTWNNYIFLFEGDSIDERLTIIANPPKPNYHVKNVIMMDLSGKILRTFSSMTEAIKFVRGKSIGNLTSCCTGKRKTCMGYKWKFDD